MMSQASGIGNDVIRVGALPRHELADVGYAMPRWVAAGDPHEFAKVFYEQASGRAVVGYWESEPGTLEIDDYPFDELCVVTAGSCVLTPARGEPSAFGVGDCFVIRKGFRGRWDMPVGLRKIYVELRD